MISQILSIIGALFVLAAYFLQQVGFYKRKDSAYLWLNLLGGGFLLVSVLIQWQVGFVILQAAWVVITLKSLLQSKKAEAP